MRITTTLQLAAGTAAIATAATVPPTLLTLAGVPPVPSALHASVVVVIDAQREYTDGHLPLAQVEVALQETARLLARARAAGVPVVHVQQVSPAGRRLFASDSPLADIVPEALPLPGETVITKRLPNAFAGTTLGEALHTLGRSELIISGYMTHMCVSATARAALDHGYHVTVIANACATRDLPDPLDPTATVPAAMIHRVALAALADRFATVVPSLDQIPD